MNENEKIVLSNDPQTHTAQKLAELQGLPLDRKIQLTQTRLIEWYNAWDGKCYVSFSGGKDSTVLADIVAQVCKINGFELVLWFSDTGLEFPEVKQHVKDFKEYLEQKYEISIKLFIDYPKDRKGNRITFRKVLEDYGYPLISKQIAKNVYDYRSAERQGTLETSYAAKQFNGTYINPHNGELSPYNCEKWKFLTEAPFKISHRCCNVMKKNTAHNFEKSSGLKPIIGTMAEEGRLRKSQWILTGCNSFDNNNPSSKPLSFWKENDVLEYIVKNNIPYPSVYGEIYQDKNGKYQTTGLDRTGCIFCGFGCHLEKEPNRFQQLKETHPKLYEYCMRPWDKGGLGMDEVLDYIGVKH